MEKLTIKPWQVMQAHENGAEIDFSSSQSECFSLIKFPSWDWGNCVYRIANLTADGMRLDELVEKFPESVTLENTEHFSGDHKTHELIKALIEKPLFISEIKVKQEKKLRPWTMAEFEKHRDEWFKLKKIDEPVVYKITAYSQSVVTVSNYSVTYAKLSHDYTFTDGSPCGVLE